MRSSAVSSGLGRVAQMLAMQAGGGGTWNRGSQELAQELATILAEGESDDGEQQSRGAW